MSMRDDDREIDQLAPPNVGPAVPGVTAGPSPLISQRPIKDSAPKSRGIQRFLIPFVIVGGVLLALSAMAAMMAMIARLGSESTKIVVVTTPRDPAALRAESTQVFGHYDAAAWDRGEIGDSSEIEREEIDALFSRVKQCAVNAHHEEFKELVDFDRLLKRCELTGNMAGWSYFDKRSWRGQMMSMAEAETYWAQITLAGIVTPDDDPNSRIVYAFCDDAESEDPTECRFWIARDADSWKIYDWSRLDLGLSESQEWGLYAKYANTNDLEGFERWGELIGEADEAIENGDFDAAREILRRAETEPMPPEFNDFHYVLTAYRWAALCDTADAERCFKAVLQPLDTPAAYSGLLRCKRRSDPAEALDYAKLYEEAIGPSPASLDVKAQLLARLNRNEEAAQEWRRLLRIEPDHVYAASEYVSSLPLESEAEFESALEQLGEPEKLVASIAAQIGHDDYERLRMIAEYVNRKSPDSAGAHHVNGLAQFLDGHYAEAARLYRAAFEKEPDKEKHQSYVNDYVEAMAADGKVVEAVKNVLDPKSVFEALYLSYDESELSLSDDEFRQVVALNREMYPDDLVAMHRDGSLAVSAERYLDAEPVLRNALQTATESEEDTEYYHGACKSLLATALYKQGKWKDAYENVGEKREQFAAIARMAADDRRWHVVRELLATHRAADAKDPKIHGVEGELAVHEKRWDDAVRNLRRGLQAAADYDKWRLRYLLIEAYVGSGRWRDHFKSSSDHGQTFKLLSDRFIADENWTATDELIAEYRSRSPDDVRILQQEAEVAWQREDYGAYVDLAQPLLSNENDAIEDYERVSMETRLTSALLRSRSFEAARQRALAELREKNDATMLAIVHAAEGDLGEAQRLALEAAREQETGMVFYTDDDTASIFLADEFSSLHDEFPVAIPYDAASPLAVFVFDKSEQLDAEEVHAVIEELEAVEEPPSEKGSDLKSLLEIAIGTVEPVESKHQDSTVAYALKHGEAVIWLAAGEGEFNEQWDLARKDVPLAETLNKGAGWLAVGTAALTQPDRERVEEIARRLGAHLVRDRATAVFVRTPANWEYAAYPATKELVADWQTSGKVKSFEDNGIAVRTETSDDLVNDREFEQAVRAAVRSFEESRTGRLEVVWYVSAHPPIDPLRLQVEKVRRTYGGLTFEGVLITDSALVPELRKGLPMELDLTSVQETRFGDEKPVRRR